MEHDLLTEVRTFLAQHDMSQSRFGRLAVNDHKIVSQIESGRRIWPETETRIRAFMAGYAAPGAPVGGAVDASTLSSDVRKVREAGGLMPHAEDICTPATPLSGGTAGDLAPLPQAPPQGAPQLAGAEPSSAPAAFSGEGAGGVVA